ncbi:unnamed protein product [Strongylus vulgaris]|uniref:Uncharacterized protein n=1 Tax=Strongylus vulgaris TaxID=40348 RepID=A0A3P7KFP6_STRVU|nr:unnamed protein product [Strongylus vulgaris]
MKIGCTTNPMAPTFPDGTFNTNDECAIAQLPHIRLPVLGFLQSDHVERILLDREIELTYLNCEDCTPEDAVPAFLS